MRTIFILKGLPGSGKSTYATEMVRKEPKRFVRINRDDLRSMSVGPANNPHTGDKNREEFVREAKNNLLSAALKSGYDVILDDTHLVPQTVKKLHTFVESIGNVSIYPQYEQTNYGSTGKVIGYTLSQQVIVDSSDVDGITKLAKDSGTLINQGIFFTSEPLEYYYSKLNDLKLDMLAEATKNAKDRAERIAESSGSKVGSMRSADMGVFQVMAVNSTEVSDYGAYDTTSIDKNVMAVVRASFSLR
jgi:hypothetical protein